MYLQECTKGGGVRIAACGTPCSVIWQKPDYPTTNAAV